MSGVHEYSFHGSGVTALSQSADGRYISLSLEFRDHYFKVNHRSQLSRICVAKRCERACPFSVCCGTVNSEGAVRENMPFA